MEGEKKCEEGFAMLNVINYVFLTAIKQYFLTMSSKLLYFMTLINFLQQVYTNFFLFSFHNLHNGTSVFQ